MSGNGGYDVAVIGMGPGGGLAARQLALSGARVVAMDRSSFPRYKVCGGCLNARALHELQRAGLDVKTLGGEAIDRFECGLGQRRVAIGLPAGCAVSRERLDAFLATAAADAGADVQLGTKCSALERENDGWLLRLESGAENRNVRAGYVIVAEGLSGGVRRQVKSFRTTVGRSSRIGAGTLLSGAAGYEPGTIYMAVGREGYVGLTVVEDGRLNVAAALDAGLIRANGSPADLARSIIESCDFPVPPGFAAAAWKGTPPLTQRTWPVAADGAFLLGDASGYVEPFTGEGMAWALEGALELAEIMVNGLQTAATDMETAWNRHYQRRFAGSQRRCRWIARGLRSRAVTVTVAEVLRAMPGLAQPVIANLNATAD